MITAKGLAAQVDQFGDHGVSLCDLGPDLGIRQDVPA
jgi:hypothetical protein